MAGTQDAPHSISSPARWSTAAVSGVEAKDPKFKVGLGRWLSV